MFDALVSVTQNEQMSFRLIIATYVLFCMQLADWLLIGFVIDWLVLDLGLIPDYDPSHAKLAVGIFVHMAVISGIWKLYKRKSIPKAKAVATQTRHAKQPE